MPWVLGEFGKADLAWLEPLLGTLAHNADLLIQGDDNTLMNKLAIAVNGDGADRSARPETADPTRKNAAPGQSHIRLVRLKSPQAAVPEEGPMAAMLRKVLGKTKD